MSEHKTFVAAHGGPAKRGRAVLAVLSGPDAGRVLPLSVKEQVSFGRAPECTYPFADGSLSRVHALIVYVAGEYMFKDEGSTNGSFINDKRVNKVGHLADGDRVQLGTALSFRFSLVTEEEEAALRRVYEAAVRDGLTGLFNRKHTDERLEAELAYALRHQSQLSIAMVDIDHFKKVNDTYGHPAGDAVLLAVSAAMTNAMRAEDVLGRYGGEEFLIVVRGIGRVEACAMAERLRASIAAVPVLWDGTPIVTTASFGVASLACCGEKADRQSLVSLADTRLYKAKDSGRNRVVGS